jgi:hypothetical protein
MADGDNCVVGFDIHYCIKGWRPRCYIYRLQMNWRMINRTGQQQEVRLDYKSIRSIIIDAVYIYQSVFHAIYPTSRFLRFSSFHLPTGYIYT